MIPARTMPISPNTSRAVPSRRRSTPSHSIAASYLPVVATGTLSASGRRAGVERIGFVGLGTMGAAMAANLRRAGFEVTAGTGRPGRADGAARARRPEAADAGGRGARESDVVVVLRVRHAGRRGGPVRRRRGGERDRPRAASSSTAPRSRPSATARLRRAAWPSAGVGFVDAPVSGGSEGAKHATLTIFVGGEPADVERARPVLEAMGKTITHFGPAGSGQAVKAVNQVVLAGAYLGVAEGIVLALKAGLDPAGGGRGARRRGGPQLGPREPQRADDRQRVPARASGPRSTSRTSRSRSRWRARSARRSRSPGWPPSSRRGSSRAATATRTCRTSRARSARCRASTG